MMNLRTSSSTVLATERRAFHRSGKISLASRLKPTQTSSIVERAICALYFSYLGSERRSGNSVCLIKDIVKDMLGITWGDGYTAGIYLKDMMLFPYLAYLFLLFFLFLLATFHTKTKQFLIGKDGQLDCPFLQILGGI